MSLINCRTTSNPKSPGGKHVTITVRETKTERINPTNDSYQDIDRYIVKSNSMAPRASSATKELDDLMASLSDFKVRTILCLFILSVNNKSVWIMMIMLEQVFDWFEVPNEFI